MQYMLVSSTMVVGDRSHLSTLISATRKPLVLLSLSSQPAKLLPAPRRTGSYFLSLLAFWACLNLSRIIFAPPPPACATREAGTLPAANEPRLRPCLKFSHAYENATWERRRRTAAGERKYMMAVVSGGLNQQRNQIVDAVVVARILGAALVVPVLQVNQVWGDESEFGDIFEERWFKERLRDDVVVVSSLPSTHVGKRRVRGPAMPFNAGEDWVRANYGPKLGREVVFILRAFDSRLSKELSADLQKLRCKVAFEALKFQPWIEERAERLVRRMGEEGPYMALHLRLEKDVWVRTGCLPGLGREADLVIRTERDSNPHLLTSRTNLTAHQRYLAGLCPLTASEITRMLKGLRVPKNRRIYWAGGEPFGGEKALEPLQSQFPKLFNKWSLVRPGELNDFEDKPSLLAALDYIVCLKSQIFMANHGGNMARSLMGHRTYMDYGVNIRPNKKLLVRLFMNKGLEEGELEMKIKQIHEESSDLAQQRRSKLKKDVIAFPTQYCKCVQSRN